MHEITCDCCLVDLSIDDWDLFELEVGMNKDHKPTCSLCFRPLFESIYRPNAFCI